MRLADYLAENSISPRVFAAQVGVSGEAIRLYLKGARRPRAETINAIRAVTGGAVTANDFFDGRDLSNAGSGA